MKHKMRFKNKIINNHYLKLLFKTLTKIVNLLTKILKLINKIWLYQLLIKKSYKIIQAIINRSQIQINLSR